MAGNRGTAVSTSRQAEGSASRWRRIRISVEILPIIWLLVLFVLAALGVRGSRTDEDWIFMVFGVLYAIHVVTDVRFGRTHVVQHAHAEDPTEYLRSADPIGFWIVIALKGAIAIAVMGATLGDLLRLWKL